MNDPVDVLIIGAGASGAAVAWSLAETKMHILCLEQGGWMNPAAYPSTGRDWEARFFGDFSPAPISGPGLRTTRSTTTTHRSRS
jgi:choline dehydrogenase-like flavoprotein